MVRRSRDDEGYITRKAGAQVQQGRPCSVGRLGLLGLTRGRNHARGREQGARARGLKLAWLRAEEWVNLWACDVGVQNQPVLGLMLLKMGHGLGLPIR